MGRLDPTPSSLRRYGAVRQGAAPVGAARVRNRYRRLVNWLINRLLPGALVILFATAIYQALTLPDFKVDRVEVSGNRLVSSAEIIEAAAIPADSIFLLDRAAIRQSVAKIRRLEGAQVRLQFPATVSIAVDERRPVAIWRSGEARFLVDEDGLVLGPAGSEQLPLVNDLDGTPAVIDGTLPAGAATIAAARALLQLAPTEIGQTLGDVDYRRDEGISFVTHRGWRVVLGVAAGDPAQDPRQSSNAPRLRYDQQREYVAGKLAILRSLADEVEKARLQVRHVDLRYGDRPYLR